MTRMKAEMFIQGITGLKMKDAARISQRSVSIMSNEGRIPPEVGDWVREKIETMLNIEPGSLFDEVELKAVKVEQEEMQTA